MHHQNTSSTFLETLESRLLLSSTPPAVELTSTAILQPPADLKVVVPQATLASMMVPESQAVLASLIARDPKLVHYYETASTLELTSAVGMIEGITPQMGKTPSYKVPPPSLTVSSISSGNVGEESDTPVIVDEPFGSSDPMPTGGLSHPFAGTGGLGAPPMGASAATTGGYSTEDPGLTAGNDNPVGSLPDAAHLVVRSSMDESHGSVSFQMPVDSLTHEVGFSVSDGSASNPADRPSVTGVMLVNQDGQVIAQLGPFTNSQDDAPIESLTIALNDVPSGGHLIVQLSAPPVGSWQTASGSTNAGDPAGATISFVMDVQKLELPSANGGSGDLTNPVGVLPATGRAALGALSWTSDTQEGTLTADAAATAEPGLGGSEMDLATNQGTSTAIGEWTSDSETANAADFGGRIASGPLAARGAAPLGPDLATVMVDPAPSVDRYERALLQEIEEQDSETSEGPVARSIRDEPRGDDSPGDDSAIPAEPAGSRNENFVAAAGLGSLPLKVSASAAHGAAVDLEALLAALPGSSHDPSASAVAADEDLAGDPLQISLTVRASSSRLDRRPAPDYLTSACILAIGMGLTAGPIIPDLLRLIPSRSSRWRLVPTFTTGLPAGSASGERGFGTWFRRRMV